MRAQKLQSASGAHGMPPKSQAPWDGAFRVAETHAAGGRIEGVTHANRRDAVKAADKLCGKGMRAVLKYDSTSGRVVLF